ncbi:MAG: hypothetical protein JRF63_06320, partial [Deltaproteobacteria bacterium]|nr:hypothetical protein [Deltaproteobacteria bacterium]
RSYKAHGGALQLLIETGLPVRTPIVPTETTTAPSSDDRVVVRMSGSAMAELVDWAIAKELVPSRYDTHGKAKQNGELRPGLDWVPGKRPMKIYLWDLERPCMRITMGAKAKVATQDGNVRIEATDGKIEDVEASAFTKVGVWFHALWKDAINVTKSAGTAMSFSVAGQRMTSRLERAAIENDELTLELSLTAAKAE